MKVDTRIMRDGVPLYYCKLCKVYKEESGFYKCSIKGRDRRCKICVSQANSAYQVAKGKDPAHLLLRRTRRYCKTHSIPCNLDLDDAHRLIRVWKSKCVFAQDETWPISSMVLIPWHPGACTPWNAVLVSKKVARSFEQGSKHSDLIEDRVEYRLRKMWKTYNKTNAVPTLK